MTKCAAFVGYPTPEARFRGVRNVSPPYLVIRIIAEILITIVERRVIGDRFDVDEEVENTHARVI